MKFPFKSIYCWFFSQGQNVFVAYFNVVDKITILSMVTFNINSGQATTIFSADTWKMTLYDMYFLEWGKEI